MSLKTIQSIIEHFQLQHHPEGGFYRRFYESTTKLHYKGYQDRPIMTSIHYLLTGQDYSHFHRFDADEMWNYYDGNTNLIIHVFYPDKTYQKMILSRAMNQYQLCVPAGCWFAAELEVKNEDSYVLSGCTVSPGFLFETFELGKKAVLTEQYPEHEALIAEMTLES